MEKRKVIEQIQSYLATELSGIVESEKQQDRERAGEIHRLLQMYRFLPVREYTASDVVCPSALVELEFNGKQTYCLIVPQGGGLIAAVDQKPVQVITPNSPLGEAMMGKKPGERFTVIVGGNAREYRITRLS